MRVSTLTATASSLILLAGCASRDYSASTAAAVTEEVINPRFAAIAAADNALERDRRAILAMQGEHRVTFHFEETVALAPGYERTKSKDSGAQELVLVVENQPDHIVMQHILVTASGHVIKHWRQDWTHQAATRLEFVSDQTWRNTQVLADKGAWTQCVFEVSDAPRYCGTGNWNHRYGVSTWTSDRTWRPLPRREYTTRDDYNALNVENRHTVTPTGWTHEQDNTKTVRNGERTERTLTREFGFNNYRSIKGFDFGPGYEYWAKTAPFWALVRAAWAERIERNDGIALATEVDGMPIIMRTFELADQVDQLDAEAQRREIEILFGEWVVAPGMLDARKIASAGSQETTP